MMLNRDIYQLDPTQNRLRNNGVAEVKDDQSEESLDTLRYELQTFVCDGEYEAGLERILSTFLRNLSTNHEQPGIWISGFFGSGKSHLAKMLRSFWTNQTFPDGTRARDIADLPQEIRDQLTELSNVANRYGGLHAASGTLGSGVSNNVRMALLNIIFKSAGLPEQYHQARFVLWLKRKGILDAVKATVEAEDNSWEDELEDLYMSRSIANALLQHDNTLATDIREVREVIRSQYPNVDDVTNQQMVDAIHDALVQDGEFPLTLVVLDEMQQYIGGDAERAHLVQETIETCCKHSKFKSKLLFVTTGQSALSSTPNLQRLMGRFQVNIQLKDTDVEAVIRKVILQKKASVKPALEQLLQTHLGEISRQLRGTKIEHHQNDEKVMVADYPLLPTRRRFWERVLRIVDTTGTVSQLRNQLKVIHEATLATADKPIGNIVPADFIYDQISINLLQTGVISREITETIGHLASGNSDDQLKGRILALILLINKLPTEPAADSGVRATADMLADLLIDDLNNGKDSIRTAVPQKLAELAEEGLLMAMETTVGTEYRLQTMESSQWYDTFRQEEAQLRGNIHRVENIRIDLLQKEIRTEVGNIHLTQGKSNVPRQIIISFDPELPRDASEKIYAWAQDGWSLDEKSFLSEARSRAADDPSIFVYIPARNRSELTNAIIAEYAARATLDKRGIPNTDAGTDARSAMETRHGDAQKQIKTLLREIFEGVQVLQAGGSQVEGSTIATRIENAANASLVRLYGEFDQADDPNWSKVYDRARKDGGQNALEAIGYKGDAEQHPVCAQIKRYIGSSKKGAEIREHFTAAPYGWPLDAIDGALFVLLAGGILLAKNANHQPVSAAQLERKQVGQTNFSPESITIRPVELIKIRGLLTACGIPCQTNDDLDRKTQDLVEHARQLAQQAGGDAPLPEHPDTQLFNDLANRSGNAKLQLILDNQTSIKDAINQWTVTGEQIKQRQPDWHLLQELLNLSRNLSFYSGIKTEVEAIVEQRALLDDPSPVSPLVQRLTDSLRNALQHHVQSYQDEYASGLAQLQQDQHWQQLSADQQDDILSRRSLLKLSQPNSSDAHEIIDALNDVSLGQWNDRTSSLVSRFEGARIDAAELLQPRLQRINLPRQTFTSAVEVDAWLEQVKQQLLEKLDDGPVTFS